MLQQHQSPPETTRIVLSTPPELNELKEKDRDFVINYLQFFVDKAVRKFVKGQKEHGGNLTDRNCHLEMENEIIDIFWYHCGEKERAKKL